MKPSLKFLIALGLSLTASNRLTAQFLDFSQPARAAALGGNLTALPEGPSALVFNPAGLAFQDQMESSARYESLFPGLENDSISTGNLTFSTSPLGPGSLGASWDHLGSNFLQQDRFRLAWGQKISGAGFLDGLAGGFSLSYLTQRYVLSTPLPGVSLNQLSASAFGLGGGLLVSLPLHLTLGLSADDLNQPNLGVVGTDRLPALFRWGLAAKLGGQAPVQVTATASQSLSNAVLETQGGIECFFQKYGVCLRAGTGTHQGAVGLGYEGSDLFIDYAYLFSVSADAQIAGVSLPGSHLLELGLKWGSPADSAVFSADFKKAREAEEAHRWDRALWYYQECLSTKPGDPASTEGKKRALVQYNLQRAERYYRDGQTAEGQGYPLEARNDFEMAAKLGPDHPEYAKALELINASTGSSAPSAEAPIAAVLQRVANLISRNNKEAAIQNLEEALQKYPRQPTLEMLLQNLKPGSAGKNSPVPETSNVQLLVKQSDIYLSKGRPDLAQKNLEEALQAQPENKEIRQKLADLKSPSQTVSAVKMKLAQDLYEKGLQMYLNGDLDGAIHSWEEALKDDPNHTKAQNNLIRAKLEKESNQP